MTRLWKEFEISDSAEFQKKLLFYSKKEEVFFFFNSNSNKTSNHLYSNYKLLAAFGIADEISFDNGLNFNNLKRFNKNNKDWIFGLFSYDLKNETENLKSENFDGINFPEMYFFVPKYVLDVNNKSVRISYLDKLSSNNEIVNLFNIIVNQDVTEYGNLENIKLSENINEFSIKKRISKADYLKSIKKIKKHIKQGDIYEMNFCQEFYSKNVDIEPINAYFKLNNISPSPFSSYVKYYDKYLISVSPERFLTKNGNKIVSQPIKGTAKRGKSKIEDEKIKLDLEQNQKERAENIMIVDLVRNDLSKTAKKNSVKVEELCKIYSFEQVHQMISTISSELETEKYDEIDVIKNAFPMGSMTGAPKIRAMELIEKYEKTKRGLYSGSVGYFTPNKNFDFNVIIRSILYNDENKNLSYIVGGAITDKSIAEDEYDECLLKAKAINQTLKNNC
ncbi:MAG: anthranilate synthase component I family protein [Bacteroidales bacterium]|nr:anthranilate synthase component I family protein [Bacteroidales bacterium]MBN2757726.1 anthranilate synthase component I family protein [Bacteroidales bacterium]